ncbi:MAG: pantetheine-phosphate adenylyltransferase [Planctomycetes bacterium]|nr:pantetheine-phosphate adenylyltransferase [Planctomycetota bacterium]
MSAKAIFPGSFDPPTLGHLDLVRRACAIFGGVTVAIGANSAKTGAFTTKERVAMLRELCVGLPVEVATYEGLLVDACRRGGYTVVVRGLRNSTDFLYEYDLGLTNKKLAPEIDTLFLLTDERYAYVSSRLLKEIVTHGGSAAAFLDPRIEQRLRERLREPKEPR